MTFFVGDRTEATTEYANILYGPDSCVFGSFGIALDMLVNLVPWWKLMEDVLDNFGAYQFGDPGAVPVAWYEALFIGPLYYMSRIRKAPCLWYWWSWMMALVFVVIPMYTMWVDEFMAVAWIWGLQLNGAWSNYAMLGTLFLIYELFVVLPGINLMGLWCERTEPFVLVQKIEAGILLFVMVGGSVGWGVLAYLAGGWTTVLTAPALLMMAATFIFLYYNLCGSRATKGKRRVANIRDWNQIAATHVL
jgi:hypothetical protein